MEAKSVERGRGGRIKSKTWTGIEEEEEGKAGTNTNGKREGKSRDKDKRVTRTEGERDNTTEETGGGRVEGQRSEEHQQDKERKTRWQPYH